MANLNEFKPNWIMTIGEYLQEQAKEQLQLDLNLSDEQFDSFLKNQYFSDEIALKLSDKYGKNPEFWFSIYDNCKKTKLRLKNKAIIRNKLRRSYQELSQYITNFKTAYKTYQRNGKNEIIEWYGKPTDFFSHLKSEIFLLKVSKNIFELKRTATILCMILKFLSNGKRKRHCVYDDSLRKMNISLDLDEKEFVLNFLQEKSRNPLKWFHTLSFKDTALFDEIYDYINHS